MNTIQIPSGHEVPTPTIGTNLLYLFENKTLFGLLFDYNVWVILVPTWQTCLENYSWVMTLYFSLLSFMKLESSPSIGNHCMILCWTISSDSLFKTPATSVWYYEWDLIICIALPEENIRMYLQSNIQILSSTTFHFHNKVHRVHKVIFNSS